MPALWASDAEATAEGNAADHLFERCFGFPVSTHLAYRVVMGIGRSLVDRELERAEALWKARRERPQDFEPTPAELRRMPRAKRLARNGST